MAIRKVNNLLDRYTFLKQYNRLARMRIPDSYLQECDIYGWYDHQDELQGGYAFAIGENMAWPKLLGTNLQFFSEYSMDQCMEFNMAWATDDLRQSYWKMVSFWMNSGRIISKYKNIKQVTFAVDARHQKLVATYARMADNVIYRGPVEKYPDREVIIFSCKRQRFNWIPILCFPCYVQRFGKYLGRRMQVVKKLAQLSIKKA